MSKIDDVKRFTNSWVKAKKDIISKSNNQELLLSILQSAKPGSPKLKFKERGAVTRSEDGLRDVIVPGFKVNINLNEQEVKTVLRSLSLSKNNLPFSFKASKEYVDGKPTISIETKGDYTGALMKNPRYVGAVNIKAYAEYAVFRGVVNSLAATSSYQFDKNKPPSSVNENHPGMKSVNDFLLITSRCYVPSNVEIDNLIDDTLTKNDRDKITDTFNQSLAKPSQIRELREKLVFEISESKNSLSKENEQDEPEAPAYHRRRMG